MSIKRAASQISENLGSGFGLDPITIISIVSTLLPMLAKCFQAETAGSPREYLQDHFDDGTQTFDQSLLNRTRPRTRRAARDNGQRGLNRDQLDQISNQSLLHALNADDAELSACMYEASSN